MIDACLSNRDMWQIEEAKQKDVNVLALSGKGLCATSVSPVPTHSEVVDTNKTGLGVSGMAKQPLVSSLQSKPDSAQRNLTKK